jgi:hypothetical protein
LYRKVQQQVSYLSHQLRLKLSSGHDTIRQLDSASLLFQAFPRATTAGFLSELRTGGFVIVEWIDFDALWM